MDVKRVAQLAKLNLTEEEQNQFAEQMQDILGFFEDLKKVDTEGLEPLVTPTPMETTWREDKSTEGMGAEAAIDNAPDKVGHLFKVPPVV